jgi:hypothetical protein
VAGEELEADMRLRQARVDIFHRSVGEAEIEETIAKVEEFSFGGTACSSKARLLSSGGP